MCSIIGYYYCHSSMNAIIRDKSDFPPLIKVELSNQTQISFKKAKIDGEFEDDIDTYDDHNGSETITSEENISNSILLR